MSADLLREAAALMRERAEAATSSPWHPAESHWRDFTDEGQSEVVVVNGRVNPAGQIGAYPGEVLALTYTPGYESNDNATEDAAHIASWHPVVALAVAAWLDEVSTEADLFPEESHPDACHCHAHAVARAYLDRSRPEGSGNPGVTGAQPDEPASQAGRPVAGGGS